MRSDSGRRRRTKEREECDVFLFLFFPSRLDPNVLFCFFLGLRFLGVDRAFSFFTEWARGRYGAPEKALAKRQARGGQQQGQSLYIEEERTRRERVRGEKKGGAIRKEERRKCLSLSLSVRARQKALKTLSTSFFQSSTGHPGPSHAALWPVPLQASQGTLPRPLQAGHSLQPSSSEQNLSEPTVRAPLPRQNSQPQVPEPPQQSHGDEGVLLYWGPECVCVCVGGGGGGGGEGVGSERLDRGSEKKMKKKRPSNCLVASTKPIEITFALTAHASSSRFCSCLARSGSMYCASSAETTESSSSSPSNERALFGGGGGVDDALASTMGRERRRLALMLLLLLLDGDDDEDSPAERRQHGGGSGCSDA